MEGEGIMTKPSAVLWIVLIAFLAMGCQKKEVALPNHPGGQIFHGLKRADVRCYRCHGNRGEGASGPPLVQEGKTIPREKFIQTVLDGRNRMPPFRSALTEEEIASIIDWLEKIGTPPTPP
jgi:mono/diheme cytochrome c family protein